MSGLSLSSSPPSTNNQSQNPIGSSQILVIFSFNTASENDIGEDRWGKSLVWPLGKL